MTDAAAMSTLPEAALTRDKLVSDIMVHLERRIPSLQSTYCPEPAT